MNWADVTFATPTALSARVKTDSLERFVGSVSLRVQPPAKTDC